MKSKLFLCLLPALSFAVSPPSAKAAANDEEPLMDAPVTPAPVFSADAEVDDENEAIPADYVSVPGDAYAHPSCIHEVPNDGSVDEDGHVHDKSGKLVKHVEPCRYKVFRGRRGRGHGRGGAQGATEAAGPGISSHVEWAEQTAPSGNEFAAVSATVVTPHDPSVLGDQTLYYWPGLQSRTDPNCGLLQPVLQWGRAFSNTVGWSIAAWWWMGTGFYHAPYVIAYLDDSIFMNAGATAACRSPSDCPDREFGVTITNQRSGQGSSLTVNPPKSCRYDWLFGAALEVDAANPVTTCTQFPWDGVVRFNNTRVLTTPAGLPRPTLTATAYTPTAGYPVADNPLQCHWHVSYNSTSTALWAY